MHDLHCVVSSRNTIAHPHIPRLTGLEHDSYVLISRILSEDESLHDEESHW